MGSFGKWIKSKVVNRFNNLILQSRKPPYHLQVHLLRQNCPFDVTEAADLKDLSVGANFHRQQPVHRDSANSGNNWCFCFRFFRFFRSVDDVGGIFGTVFLKLWHREEQLRFLPGFMQAFLSCWIRVQREKPLPWFSDWSQLKPQYLKVLRSKRNRELNRSVDWGCVPAFFGFRLLKTCAGPNDTIPRDPVEILTVPCPSILLIDIIDIINAMDEEIEDPKIRMFTKSK